MILRAGEVSAVILAGASFFKQALGYYVISFNHFTGCCSESGRHSSSGYPVCQDGETSSSDLSVGSPWVVYFALAYGHWCRRGKETQKARLRQARLIHAVKISNKPLSCSWGIVGQDWCSILTVESHDQQRSPSVIQPSKSQFVPAAEVSPLSWPACDEIPGGDCILQPDRRCVIQHNVF